MDLKNRVSPHQAQRVSNLVAAHLALALSMPVQIPPGYSSSARHAEEEYEGGQHPPATAGLSDGVPCYRHGFHFFLPFVTIPIQGKKSR